MPEWSRDPGVSEMVRWLDQKAKDTPDWDRLSNEERFSLLKIAERRAVADQFRMCADDFSYAARNYFMITDKHGEDKLFTLWESQYLVLQKYYELKAKGKAQKIMIVKARQLGALAPWSKVLTANLEWKPIEDLAVGDSVMASDEFPSGRGSARKLRTATILNKWSVRKPSYRIRLSNGATIEATEDHPFLCRRRGATWSEWRTVAKMGTRKQTAPLRAGDKIRYVFDQWTRRDGFEDGWFSGLIDGEGSLRAKDGGGIELCVAQVAGPVLDRACRYLTDRGYYFRIEVDNRKAGENSKLGNKPVYKIVMNRMSEVVRILGELRPSRFEGRRPWEGKDIPSVNGTGPWVEVESVDFIGDQWMVDIETSTKTFVAEGVVTHNCSVLIEAMIAWRTMFFPNTEALVVSVDADHAEYLFGLMLHIYDQMPWWLKPQAASLEYKKGLHFDNPDRDARRLKPGLNSKVNVQHANQMSGVGQGRRVSAAHCSEYTDWLQEKAEEIIEGDLLHAIADNAESFGFLESTGRGAGTYSHSLWKSCEKMAERAEWYPLFLPWFFESSRRVISVPKGWKIERPEAAMRDRVKREWVRCDSCNQYLSAAMYGESRAETTCPSCNAGALHSVILSDEQIYWKEGKRINAQDKGVDALKKHKQEMSTSAEEAWQLSGSAIFDEACQEQVVATIIDPDKSPGVKVGYFDRQARLHGVDGRDECRCYIKACNLDHRHDAEDFNVIVWEDPKKGLGYSVGVDISEGIGQDYSVIFVNKIGVGGWPDEQVAMMRSNCIEPLDLAFYANLIGRWYNDALMCVEYNSGVGRECGNQILHNYQYPNVYRWLNPESKNPITTKYHWYTQYSNKANLWHTARKWIKSACWVIRSKNFLAEMLSFQKDDDDSKMASHEKGCHDDELMAGMIALYCAHQMRADDTGKIPIPIIQKEAEAPRYSMECVRCGFGWGSDNPEMEYRCANCGSVNLKGTGLESDSSRHLTGWPGDTTPGEGLDSSPVLVYDQL